MCSLRIQEECVAPSSADEDLCANMKNLFDSLDKALIAESATLDQAVEQVGCLAALMTNALNICI